MILEGNIIKNNEIQRNYKFFSSAIICFSLFILIFIAGFGCNNTPVREVKSFQGLTMGTTYSIKYVQEKSLKSTDAVKKAVDAKLDKINSVMSTWNPESD